MTDPLRVVVTGASGVVGLAVVAALAERHRVTALVHANPDVPGADEVVRVDITRPRLGLDPARWDSLVDETDVVVHSAALTTWGLDDERYRAANVDGTAHVAELAVAAGAPLYHVSTAFLAALDSARFEAVVRPGNVVTPYIRSKRLAEQIVREAGVPYAIVRPTNLVGDSVTGASSRPQIVQLISAWLLRGKAPYVPAHPGNLVDVVPLDVVSATLAGMVETNDVGNEYWLTYGADSLSIEDVQAILLDVAARRGRQLPIAPVVDPREPLPVALDLVPPLSRAFLEVAIDVSEVTFACGGTLPTSLPELGERYPLPSASPEAAFRRSLDYWQGRRTPVRA